MYDRLRLREGVSSPMPSAEQVRQFGGFTLEPDAGTLSRDGTVIPLRPKSFAVLWHLSDHAGRVVSKEELLAKEWPSVIVGDDSLVQCIGEIRVALEDRDRQLIQTIAGRGYRLQAHVETVGLSDTLADADSSGKGFADELASVTASSMRNEASAHGDTWRWKLWTAIAVAMVMTTVALLIGPVTNPSANVDATRGISIAVLPLRNLTGDKEQGYLGEALTYEITKDLSRLKDSFVIAPQSMSSYRDMDTDARTVGRDLNVRYLLQGGVLRHGTGIRLNLALVDTSTGQQLWAEPFDADREQIGTLRGSVTDRVAQTLRIQLYSAEAARGQRERPENPEARDLAMRGWVLWNRQRPETVAEGREKLLQSLKLDPNSAFAWETLAYTYVADILHRWMPLRGHTREEWMKRLEEAAAKAYALDRDYLQPTCTVLMLHGEFERALTCRESVIANNRNDPIAYHLAALTQIYLGHPEKSFKYEAEALRISPRDSRMHNFLGVTAMAHLHLGEFEEALAFAEQAVAVNPTYVFGHTLIAAAAAQCGDMKKAEAAVAELQKLQPNLTIETYRKEQLSDRPAYLVQRERLYAGLGKAGLPPVPVGVASEVNR